MWRVGGFEFGHLLQCGGGGAGREACNVPRGWTTGSSSLLAGVLLRLGRIAAQDFEGSSNSRVSMAIEALGGPSCGSRLGGP